MPVNSTHADYDKFSGKWKRCRDVSAGQDAVHAGGEAYLPKLKDQQDADYKAYVMRASFYNATWRTIAGLVGMLFRQPPAVEVPEVLKALLEDVDAAGTPMQLFAQAVSEDALEVGRIGILVDVPTVATVAGAAPTLADAQAQGIRPTLQLYTAEAIINWKTARVANRTALAMLVLKEVESIKVDDYASKDEDRWRVLELVGGAYRQQVFKRKTTTQSGQAASQTDFEQVGDDLFPMMRGKSMDFIPFVFLGTDNIAPDVDEPPLIDLVDLNLSHYRTTADHAHGCHFTALPTLFLAGFKTENPTDKVYIGSEAAIVTSNSEATADFIEFSGAGIAAIERKLEREEQQMAILGARMLEPQRKAVEAADTASIHRKGEESMLSSAAQAISLGLTQALRWFADFAGLESGEVKYELNRDFYPARMAPAELSALIGAWQQGAISDQTLFENLQQGEIIARETTLEEEQARVADRQQQLADQAAALQGTMSLPGGAAVDRSEVAL
jgi:hypothetical protein